MDSGSISEAVARAQTIALAAGWRSLETSTARADRAAVEAALADLYVVSGWRPPRTVLWCESPLAAADVVAESHEPSLIFSGIERLGWAAVPGVSPEIWHDLRCEFSRTSRDRVKAFIDAALRARAPKIARRLERAGCGRLDAGWVGIFDALERVHGIVPSEGIVALRTLTRNCGWWFPLRTIAVLCEPEVNLRRDDRGRPHAEDGPAVAYADGEGVYALHGVRVERRIIENPATLDVATILDAGDADVRRVLIARYGVKRFLFDVGADVAARDRFGTLLRAERGLDEPLVFVHVKSPMPDPDGTVHESFLRVPPTMRTAREAVAWTFGLAPEAFAPERDTWRSPRRYEATARSNSSRPSGVTRTDIRSPRNDAVIQRRTVLT